MRPLESSMWWWSVALAATGQLEGAFERLEISAACTVSMQHSHTPGLKWQTDRGELAVRIDQGSLLIVGRETKNCTVDVGFEALSRIGATQAAIVKVGALESARVELVTDAGASIEVDSVKAERLRIHADGASTLTLHQGRVRFHKAELEGASSLFADEVMADAADVKASGASAADVGVIQHLTANATGSSAIRYAGGPNQREARADLTSTITAR